MDLEKIYVAKITHWLSTVKVLKFLKITFPSHPTRSKCTFLKARIVAVFSKYKMNHFLKCIIAVIEIALIAHFPLSQNFHLECYHFTSLVIRIQMCDSLINSSCFFPVSTDCRKLK